MPESLQRLWHVLSNIGIHNSLARVEVRKIRLVNQVVLLTVPIYLVLIVINIFLKDWIGIVFISGFLGLMGIGLLLNYLRRYLLCRWYLLIGCCIALMGLVWVYGPDCGIEGPLIVICISLLILFDKKPGYQLLTLVWVASMYVWAQFGFNGHTPPLMDEINRLVVHGIYIGSMIACALMVRTYLQFANQYEKTLESSLHTTKQKNRELALANEDLEQFAAVASHDLKTPLRNINSLLGLIERKLDKSAQAEVQEYMDTVKDNARHMFFLVEDILKYARLEQEQEWVTQTLPLRPMALQVRGNVLQAMDLKQAVVQIDPLPVLKGNQYQLELVFQNLMENALKYNEQPIPRLHIWAERDETETMVCFEDNGIGIPVEYQVQVFEMFSRLHSRNEYPGSGIGLAICQKIMALHGGSIAVRHSSEKGTTICVHFPTFMVLEQAPYEVSLDSL